MQRAGAQPAGTGLGAGGCKDLIPNSSLGRSRNGGTWHRERGKKWESTKSLLLCSQEPLSQPQPAPAWAPSPPQRAGLGTHSFCRMQRAQPARNCSLEREKQPRNQARNVKEEHRGFHPREDTRGSWWDRGAGAGALQSCVQGFVLFPFYSHRDEPIGGTIKASPKLGVQGRIRPGCSRGAPKLLRDETWPLPNASVLGFILLTERFHGNSCTSFTI